MKTLTKIIALTSLTLTFWSLSHNFSPNKPVRKTIYLVKTYEKPSPLESVIANLPIVSPSTSQDYLQIQEKNPYLPLRLEDPEPLHNLSYK